MSTEKRILIAFVASAVVFAVWTMIFPPPKPAPKVGGVPVETQTDMPTPTPAVRDVEEQGPAGSEEAKEGPGEEDVPAAEPPLSGTEVQTFTLENNVLRIEFTNQGACATSVVLKKYSGDQGETLDLVQSVVHPQRSFPLQMVIGERPDTRLYHVEAGPRKLDFEWRDAQGNEVKKVIEMPEKGYSLNVDVETTDENATLSLGTGMRDTDIVERENRFATWGDAVVVRASEKKKESYRRHCDEKSDSELWLKVHKIAHQLGISSNATILYGHVETYKHRIDHLNRIRNLQDQTGGFNAFIPLKFRNSNNKLSYINEVSVVEDMRNYAVTRIFLDNIPHLKAYWVMLGRQFAQMSLAYGVDDLDGTIDDTTKIYTMAGVEETSPRMTASDMIKLIKEANLTPVERDSVYNELKIY